jgi:sugar O-acyltransferase (sialic acid O-acetyltransferase NeuD family)
MKQISILGLHPVYAEVILEVITETLGPVSFDILLNVEIPGILSFHTRPDIRHIHQPRASGLAEGPCCFGTAGPWNKQRIVEDFSRSHGLMPTDYLRIIHPTTYVAGSAVIDNGTFIEPMCSISSATHIGFGTTIKRGVQIGHHNRIGAYCDINPGVILSGSCTIGEGTTLGSGTVVRDGVTIGSHVFIGMGSVVTSDIPDGMLAYGNPCRIIRPFEHGRTYHS